MKNIGGVRGGKALGENRMRPNGRNVGTKIHMVAALFSALMGGTLNAAAAGPAPQTGIKNVVLVHGAFADGSGWEAVANILQNDGYTESVVQHPETSYAEDVKFTKAVIDRQSGPVVLVGHSYGGAGWATFPSALNNSPAAHCLLKAGSLASGT